MDFEIDRLIDVTERAGEIVIKKYGKEKRVRTKEDKTIVTSADLESEKFLRSKLKEIDSTFSIISEETTDFMTTSDFSWIIDPLDGTSNFVHQVPLFGIMVAVCKKSRPIMGVVHLPALEETFYAEKGKGAFRGNDKLVVSEGKLERGFATYGSKFKRKDAWESLDKVREVFSWIRSLGSAAVNLVKVAEGGAEASLEFGIHPWDFLAPTLIIEEAGGKVTDLKGKEIGMETENIIASNGKEHSKLLEILNE